MAQNFGIDDKKTVKSLVIFFGACSFDCLFCHNWYFRDHLSQPNVVGAEELALQVEEDTRQVFMHGGDPTPQITHAIDTADQIIKNDKGRNITISFETNGAMNEAYAKKLADLSLSTGGSIKIDLKAFDPNLHYALTGISNEWTLKNFKVVAKMQEQKGLHPILIASTPLIPGYIDAEEITHIAKFIAKTDPAIPYILSAFYPQFYMYDLPATSKSMAHECVKAAKSAGLLNVRLGNEHLLK
jgi:pyruvate formate lyase activating enzyme